MVRTHSVTHAHRAHDTIALVGAAGYQREGHRDRWSCDRGKRHSAHEAGIPLEPARVAAGTVPIPHEYRAGAIDVLRVILPRRRPLRIDLLPWRCPSLPARSTCDVRAGRIAAAVPVACDGVKIIDRNGNRTVATLGHLVFRILVVLVELDHKALQVFVEGVRAVVRRAL